MLNSTRKHLLVTPFAFAIMLIIFALPNIQPPNFVANAQVESNPDLRRYEFVPDHIVYRTLFHSIFLLNQEASKAERVGQSNTALAFRRAFTQDAALGDEQAVILNGIAAQCEQAVRAIDARARMIIAARRANYPDGKLRAGQQPLPPSPELAALQQERDTLILHYRDRLREAFGESEWQRFERLVPSRVTAGITRQRAQPRSAFVKASLKTTNTMAQMNAQSVITGSTLISYDAYSNIVTAVSTTELDFFAQDWYQGRVWANISDANGNVLASGQANDIDRDGTVSITMQTTGQDQMTYSARGNYGAIADIQDPARGFGYYIDRWNFQEVYRGGEGGTLYYLYMPFYGFGPSRSTRLRNLFLGSTTPATVQAKGDLKSKKPSLSDNDINVESAVGIENESTDVITQIEASNFGLEDTDKVVVEIITATGNGAAITWANGQISEPTAIARGQSISVSFHISSVSQAGTYTFRTRIVDVQRRNQDGSYRSIYNSLTTNANGEISDTLTVRN